MSSIYLINPATDQPHYFAAEVYGASGLSPKMYMGDLAITTIAGMLPEGFSVELCEGSTQEIDYNTPAKFIGITGKVSQWENMKKITEKFRSLGKTVIIGGPLASLSPEIVRPYCDILVRGEIEDIYPALMNDLKSDSYKEEYMGTYPDLALSVNPRFDLYPNESTLMGSIQTSRGCPFSCDFCEVTQYNGTKQRYKPIKNILEELDLLSEYDYSTVFITDDNFSGNHNSAKEILKALKYWNKNNQDKQVNFMTQASLDVSKDEELLQFFMEADLTGLFVGIETVNTESLKQAKKNQNVNMNMVDQILKILDYGISVASGFIIGFDADTIDIFTDMYNYAMSMPIPMYSIGCLVAPLSTPLYKKVQKEGRVIDEGDVGIAAVPWKTNFMPNNMTLEQLYGGMKWLCSNLYHPKAFEKRILDLLENYNFSRLESKSNTSKSANSDKRLYLYEDANKLIKEVTLLGAEEKQMVERLMKRAYGDANEMNLIVSYLLQYAQIRFVYKKGDVYNPGLVGKQYSANNDN
jgi:radical SAM superfamily enzyme YgiQ (UPF0313 family)